MHHLRGNGIPAGPFARLF